MKKKFILLFMIMCLIGGGKISHLNAQVEISGDGSTNYNVPCRTDSYYGLSQQIYLQSEIGAGNIGKQITHIAFSCANSPVLNGVPAYRNLDIYLTTTTKSSFTGDYVPMAVGDKPEYSGRVTFENGWVEITLDNPFVYTGENLLVTVNDKTGVKTSQSTVNGRLKFNTFKTSNIRRSQYQQSNTEYNNPTSSMSGFSTPNSYNVPSIKLYMSEVQSIEPGDTWGNAIEIAEEDYDSTDEPAFAKLKNNYELPGEEQNGNDVVYKFNFTNTAKVNASVTGANGKIALYTADVVEQEGIGPDNYYGAEDDSEPTPGGLTTFFYDFEDGDLSDFTNTDADGDGKKWYVSAYGVGNTKSIASNSCDDAALTPDNYIYTNSTFSITESSKLSYDVKAGGYDDTYSVVLKDVQGNEYEVFKETYGAVEHYNKTIELDEYAGNDYYIGFRHHDCTDRMAIYIDNIFLNDGSAKRNRANLINETVPAGTYYVVASATEQFSVAFNVTELENGDIWEDAIEIAEYPYESGTEFDFAKLQNNYELPGEETDGNDVVYKLVFTGDATVNASVTGVNGKIALYAADFGGQEGPSKDNSVIAPATEALVNSINGEVPAGTYYLVASAAEAFTVSVDVVFTKVFKGNSGGNWFCSTSWSGGVLPNENDNVRIEAEAYIVETGYLHTTYKPVKVNNLTFGDAGSLTLENGTELTVSGELINTDAAKLVIDDGAQLYQNSENVQATFNMNIVNPQDWTNGGVNGDGWQFIGSPFTDATTADFLADSNPGGNEGGGDQGGGDGNYGGTSFTYNFKEETAENSEDGKFELTKDNLESIFDLIDLDGDGINWFIYESVDMYGDMHRYLRSSYQSYEVNNVIKTKKYYNISESSKFSISALTYDDWYGSKDKIYVGFSSAGTNNFTWLEPIVPEYTEKTIDIQIGQELSKLGLECGNYHIALRHNETNLMYADVAKIILTDGSAKSVAINEEEGDYDLYMYDGMQNGSEWRNYKAIPFNTFNPGVGYLFSHETETTMPMTGTLNTVNPFDAYNVYAGPLSENDLANFYLFSNPFTYDINWSDFELPVDYEDNELTIDGFATVNQDGGYSYGNDNSNNVIKVGDGFFVKAVGNYPVLHYNPNSDAKSTRERTESLSLVATGAAGSDNVVISLAGSDKEGFNKLQNLNDAIANIYVLNGGVRYGIGNYDRDVKEVEVAFEAKEMGNYSISAQPNGKFEQITLVDRMTGEETNLLMEDYHFTATSRDNYNRFVVKFAMTEGETATEEAFVYQSGEELVVDAEGAVQIIDVMGRVVYSGDVTDSNNRINVSDMNNAAYIVRIVSENGVKTQKVVIF